MTKANNETTLKDVHRQLIDRDAADAKISVKNKQELIEKGLKTISPKRKIAIDTGEIYGVKKVVDIIYNKLASDDRIIAIEGLSGVGKSSTTLELKKRLSAISFSFGEIFRYLCYMEFIRDKKDHIENISKVSYQITNNSLCLFDGDNNITEKLFVQLCDPSLVALVPKTASITQELVINFMAGEIQKIGAKEDVIILIEGRDYTLDFLPCDLRIELYADSIIRAERRLKQKVDQ